MTEGAENADLSLTDRERRFLDQLATDGYDGLLTRNGGLWMPSERRSVVEGLRRKGWRPTDAEWDHLPAVVRAALDPGSVDTNDGSSQ